MVLLQQIENRGQFFQNEINTLWEKWHTLLFESTVIQSVVQISVYFTDDPISTSNNNSERFKKVYKRLKVFIPAYKQTAVQRRRQQSLGFEKRAVF